MKRNTHIINAVNKPLGRLAVEISKLLRGKNKVSFSPNKDEGDFVIVKNIEKIKITGDKLNKKIYYHHSGYPGGLKKIPMKKIFKENPEQILKKAVWGMLPGNKLRQQQIKRLKIEK
jgi:large subunit ribosomal protein L13